MRKYYSEFEFTHEKLYQIRLPAKAGVLREHSERSSGVIICQSGRTNPRGYVLRKVRVWWILVMAVYLTGGCAPSITSSKPRDRFQALNVHSYDQATLAGIALKDKDRDVRRAAVQKLTDQVLLAKVVVENSDWNTRRVAILHLTDQVLLANFAGRQRQR